MQRNKTEMSSLEIASSFDSRTLEWDKHPLLRAIQTRQFPVLRKFLEMDKHFVFGLLDSINLAKTETGQTPLMVTFLDGKRVSADKLYRTAKSLLEKFKLDPNAQDNRGRTALMYAILQDLDTRFIQLLIRNGADVKLQDHHQLSALSYAAARKRTDVIRIICPDYRAKIWEALQSKFASFDCLSDRLRLSPRSELLEVPPIEGSPKRNNMPSDMSPIGGTPVNGIRFRLSPGTPASGSSPLSLVVNCTQPRRTSVDTRRTSEDKTTSTSKTGTIDIFYAKVMRRVSSATFDSRLHSGNCGTLQFAQLTQNLCIYLEEADYLMDKSPEPRDVVEKQYNLSDVIEDEAAQLSEPRRVSLQSVSAPILIKSRSVEESINRHYDPNVSFRALPRENRKNALAGGHLIERQGSAPQLQLKRKPRGSAESTGSTNVTPVGGLSRNATRQQILFPLAKAPLANHLQK